MNQSIETLTELLVAKIAENIKLVENHLDETKEIIAERDNYKGKYEILSLQQKDAVAEIKSLHNERCKLEELNATHAGNIDKLTQQFNILVNKYKVDVGELTKQLKQANDKNTRLVAIISNNTISNNIKEFTSSEELADEKGTIAEILKKYKVYGIRYKNMLISNSGEKNDYDIFLISPDADSEDEGINIEMSSDEDGHGEIDYSITNGIDKYSYDNSKELSTNKNPNLHKELCEGKTIELGYGFTLCYAKLTDEDEDEDDYNLRIMNSSGETVIVIDGCDHYDIYAPDNISISDSIGLCDSRNYKNVTIDVGDDESGDDESDDDESE